MSWSERSVRNHKRQTDCAIRIAYANLASEPLVLERFHEILHCARVRARRLFEAPILDGHHAGVDALVHLSRFRGAHIRAASGWQGTTASWRPAVASLAHHLICDYKVPMFLASCWYARDSGGDTQRGWFVAHARGARFRSLDLPIAMTRRMEHVFLASPDHVTIEAAMRRAELTALGMPAGFLKAILATRLSADLDNGEFWRTFWLFLIRNLREMEPEQVGPMIDYIHAVRHEMTMIETPIGMRRLGPVQPAFSMKGRTVRSMLRLMEEWHRSLGAGNSAFAWTRSPLEPWLLEEATEERTEAPRRWQMMELTNSAQLRMEGAALRHCVASYADRCYRGSTSIWSLRLWQGEKVRSILTVEVDPKRCAVVQARGTANRVASGKPLRLLQEWAARERLRMAI